MNSKIILKLGILKGWSFTDKFRNEHAEQIENLNKLFDEMYLNAFSVWQAKEHNKENPLLQQRFCDLLDYFFDNGVIVEYGGDGTPFGTKQEYRDYILNYKEEI